MITTIQRPTESVRKFVSRLRGVGAPLIVIGDKKGPATFDLEGVEFLSLAAQLESEFDLARKLPTGHYARKNIGYLEAIRRGSSCIYETDDDNAPLDSWMPRAETLGAVALEQDLSAREPARPFEQASQDRHQTQRACLQAPQHHRSGRHRR